MKKILLIGLTLLLIACNKAGEKMPVQEGWEIYENDLYSLHYPSDWEMDEEQQGTGGPATGIRTDFYNISVDSPACPDEMIHVAIDTAYWYDTDFLIGPSFKTMVKSEWAYAGMEPQLGKWSGELVKTTIGGKDAYQVDSLGWETGCDSKDYVVSTMDDHYMTIEVSAGLAEVNQDLIKQVLESIHFKK